MRHRFYVELTLRGYVDASGPNPEELADELQQTITAADLNVTSDDAEVYDYEQISDE